MNRMRVTVSVREYIYLLGNIISCTTFTKLEAKMTHKKGDRNFILTSYYVEPWVEFYFF